MWEDYRWALLIATIANIWGDKDADLLAPHDIFPHLPRPRRPEQTPDHIKMMARAFALAHGGKVIESTTNG